jgi:hypothetical protein
VSENCVSGGDGGGSVAGARAGMEVSAGANASSVRPSFSRELVAEISALDTIPTEVLPSAFPAG